MLANDDIYVKNTDPTATINPKIVGAFYINSKIAVVWVCVDNTINKNVWKRTGYALEEIWDYVNPKIPRPTPKLECISIGVDGIELDRYVGLGNRTMSEVKSDVWYSTGDYFTFIQTDYSLVGAGGNIILKPIRGGVTQNTGNTSEGIAVLIPQNYQWKLTSNHGSKNFIGVIYIMKFIVK